MEKNNLFKLLKSFQIIAKNSQNILWMYTSVLKTKPHAHRKFHNEESCLPSCLKKTCQGRQWRPHPHCAGQCLSNQNGSITLKKKKSSYKGWNSRHTGLALYTGYVHTAPPETASGHNSSFTSRQIKHEKWICL